MLRLFVAITLPAEALRACGEECQRVAAALGKLARGVKFPRPEGLHFTLKFLGWVPEEGAGAVREGLERAAAGLAPFRVSLSGFQAFPSARRPRVVYIGVTEGAEPMKVLAERVEREIAPLGYPTEKRGFTPHVTLLRVKDEKSASKIGAAVATLAACEPVVFQAENVVLMQSQLNPAGSIYTPYAVVPLR